MKMMTRYPGTCSIVLVLCIAMLPLADVAAARRANEARAVDADGNRTDRSERTAVTVAVGGGAGPGLAGTRHLFVWDNSIPGNVDETDALPGK